VERRTDGRTGRRDECNRRLFFSRLRRMHLEVCHCHQLWIYLFITRSHVLTIYMELLQSLYWFGGTRIRLSARRPVILTENSVPFLISPGKFFGDYLTLGHDCLRQHPFHFFIFQPSNRASADSSGRAVQGVGLRPLVCRHCGFESRWGHGCLSWVLCVVR